MNESRRSFLKLAAVTLASLPFAGKLLSAPARAADADLPFAKENEEPAKSLHYCPNADKPSKSCAALRKNKEKKDQYCYNCQLFQKMSGDAKKATGKCMVMNKKVPGNGWCNSWVQNPAVKS